MSTEAQERLRVALLALETAMAAFKANRPVLAIARVCVALDELRRVVSNPVAVPGIALGPEPVEEER